MYGIVIHDTTNASYSWVTLGTPGEHSKALFCTEDIGYALAQARFMYQTGLAANPKQYHLKVAMFARNGTPMNFYDISNDDGLIKLQPMT